MTKRSGGEILKLKRKSKYSIFFFIFFIVLASVGTWYFAIHKGNIIGHNQIKAFNGVMGIDELMLKEDHLIYLEGQYEFYWGKYWYPEDFRNGLVTQKPEYVELPSVWNDYTPNHEVEGYATYHLKIKVPYDDWYGIKIKEFDCAYRIWANDRLVQSGVPGVSKQTTIPSWKRNEVYCNSKNNEIDLVMQIANFSHRKGGPEDVLIFGKGKDLMSYKNLQLGLSTFLFGALIILAIYFGGLYVFGRNEPSVSYFSLLCFFMALRLITTGEKVLIEMLPGINWAFAVRLEYFSYTIMVPLFLYFMRSFYPFIFSRFVARVVGILAIIFSMGLLFPPWIFSFTPIVYQFVVLFVAVYILWGMLVAVRGKQEFSFIFTMGYLFFFVILINDILYYNKLIETTFMMPFGMFVLIFSYTFAMSQKMTFAYIDVDLLTQALNKQNRKLENRVKKRTQVVLEQQNELIQQKEELEKANEKLVKLDRYKNEMTSMIVHDLKNPLNSIINLANIDDIPDKNEMIAYSGKEMLNLVMNLLDLNRADEVGIQTKLSRNLLSELWTSVKNDVSLLLVKRNINVEWESSGDYLLSCDKDLIKRVLVNLLTNAIRFSPLDGNIFIETKDVENGFLKITIKDQGPGISEDKIAVIFQRYKHFDSTVHGAKSTGLGLAFCKLVIDAHNGDIGAVSPGVGSEFYFTVPLIEVIKKEDSQLESVVINDLNDAGRDIQDLNKNDIRLVIEDLSQLEIYEISAINLHLKKLHGFNSEVMNNWIKRLEQVVNECDAVKYKTIIKDMQRLFET